MNFGCSGAGVGGWIAMTIFWVGLLALLVWTVARLTPGWRGTGSGSSGPHDQGGGPSESAEEIVDRRFASGELDEDTYQSMRAALRSSRGTGYGPR